ncbi:hypothetical protein predicted by Glimmer/Critica [Limosilactobacillus fermentum]|nr:hypothetical protein predicted by Glimmer/Critica [Limosilactobacillus fermentum]
MILSHEQKVFDDRSPLNLQKLYTMKVEGLHGLVKL